MDEQERHYANKLAYEIDSWDLKVALEAGEKIIVVDTRSPEAYGAGHVPGAINLPHRTLTEENTRQLEHDALIVTYCDGVGCNASTKGALKFVRLGFRVKELIGGLDWWRRDGHSTHTVTAAVEAATCGCE